MQRTNKETTNCRDQTTHRTEEDCAMPRRHTIPCMRLNTYGLLGLVFLGPILIPPAQAQLPNPFCNAFTIGLAWIGGIVGLATLVYGAQLVLRHFFGHMGGDLTRGALSIAGGLFILGLLMNNGAGLTAVAQAFGFTGFTLGCGS